MNQIELLQKCKSFLESENDLREDIRHAISAILMDTSEDKPKKVNITIDTDEVYGLSSQEYPVITSCWQHPTEGYIYFQIDGYGNPTDFDYMDTHELIDIYKQLLMENGN